MPDLYDSRGNIVKSVPNFDPYFFRSGRSQNTGLSGQITRRPYAKHSWVYACAKVITNNIASLPKILYSRKTNETIGDHPIIDKFMNPNPWMVGNELWQAILLYLMLPTIHTPGGQAFLYFESGKKDKRVDIRKGEIPFEIYPFSDNVIRPRLDENDSLLGWKMKIGSYERDLDPGEMLRIRLFNPYSPHLGLSPYSAAEIAVTQDAQADEYNIQYYENNGAIGGMLSTENEMTREQMRKYLQSWEEQTTGAGNTGKTMILGNGIKYEQFMQRKVDMQFIEQRKDDRQRIQADYGVPDSEIAIFESGMNRATATQASRNFWTKTLMPIDNIIWQALNFRWIKNINPGTLVGKSDMSSVEALQEDYSDAIKNAETLVKMNVPPAEALRVAGVPVEVDKYPWLEEAFINSMLIPASSYTAPAKTDENKSVAPRIDNKTAKADDANEKRKLRDIIWESYNSEVLEPGEKSMRTLFQKSFAAQRNAILDKVDDWLKGQSNPEKPMEERAVTKQTVSVEFFLFDILDETDKMAAQYKPVLEKQMKRSKKRVEDELNKPVEWQVNPENIDSAMENRLKSIRGINTTTFNAARNTIAETVSQGIEENLTPAELARDLKENIEHVYVGRINNSQTIARTEIGVISSDSRFSAFKSEGIRKHEWLSSKDELVRTHPWNHAIDGETVELGRLFSNDLRYPLDPGGAAGNIINCRCVALAVVEE